MGDEENFDIFEKIGYLIDELRKMQKEAIKFIRNDLHSDQLNIGLYKDIGKNTLSIKYLATSKSLLREVLGLIGEVTKWSNFVRFDIRK